MHRTKPLSVLHKMRAKNFIPSYPVNARKIYHIQSENIRKEA